MKAMILAAGRGERMGALTDQCPKPLLQVGGMPLIEHHLRHLSLTGITDVVINTSYLGEQIRTTLGNGERWGLSITYTVEPQRLDSGGGIFNALPLLGAEPFLLVNGDVWTDLPLAKLKLPANTQAHLVLVPNPAHNPRGDFVLTASGQVHSEGEARLTYSGIALLSPTLFSACTDTIFPLAPLLRHAMQAGQVSGERYDGIWIDVGTPERLAFVNNHLALPYKDISA